MTCIVCVDEDGNLTANNLSGTNTGDQTITLTGDVTGTGTGSFATTIANNAVTYAKMQDTSAADVLIGRGDGAGAGDPQEITLGTGLAMSGTTLNVVGAWELVSSQEMTSGTTISFTGFVEGYDYMIEFSDVTLSTNGHITAQFGTGSTPTYQSSSYRWSHGGVWSDTNLTNSVSRYQCYLETSFTSALHIGGYGPITSTYGYDTAHSVHGEILLRNPGRNAVTQMTFKCQGDAHDAGSGNLGPLMETGMGDRTVVEVVTALQITLPGVSSGLWSFWKRRNQ